MTEPFIFIGNTVKLIFRVFWRLSLIKKTAVIILLLIAGWFIIPKVISQRETTQYQTTQAEKGTLVTSISASGTISSGNNTSITTSVSGVVDKLYVQNGNSVSRGDKIADISLDQESLQKQAAAWASYLSAQNSLNTAKAKMNSLQSALFKANQAFINDKGISNPSDQQKSDPKYIQENADWLQAESDYNNQAGIISQAQASLTSSWLAYQQYSSEILAPVSGVISSLSIAEGSLITTGNTSNSSNNSSNTNTSSSQSIGTVTAEKNQLQAKVNVSEVDIPHVRVGQKVTMTLDAFTDKTFTGRVTAIDTSGAVSSGVTTYPVTISFDSALNTIYPNMAVSAKIITSVKTDALLVPSAAVQTVNGQSTVRVLNNGQISEVSVDVGDSNDTDTEIVSGLQEGDYVVTGTSSAGGSRSQSGTTSPFGGFGGRGAGGGGGVFIRGR